MHHSTPGPARPGLRVLEEGQVAAGAALLVGVKEVVDGRIVLVDGLLDQPHAEDANVEVNVAGGVARNAGDVVDAFEAHLATVTIGCWLSPLALVPRPRPPKAVSSSYTDAARTSTTSSPCSMRLIPSDASSARRPGGRCRFRPAAHTGTRSAESARPSRRRFTRAIAPPGNGSTRSSQSRAWSTTGSCSAASRRAASCPT